MFGALACIIYIYILGLLSEKLSDDFSSCFRGFFVSFLFVLLCFPTPVFWVERESPLYAAAKKSDVKVVEKLTASVDRNEGVTLNEMRLV